MSDNSELVVELREKILKRLAVPDVDPQSVTETTPLFQGGLGLDSLDALEISVLVEEEFGIVIQVAERDQAVFGTLGGLAKFVAANRGRDRARPAVQVSGAS